MFDLLCYRLEQYRPRTAALLVTMPELCPVETAYYAAFVFIYLRVWSESADRKPLRLLISTDLHDFTFFEVAASNQPALDLFDKLLSCYQAEEAELRAS